MDKKRIALSIGFILVTIGLGIALYYVFFAPKSSLIPDQTNNPGQNGQFPTANDGSTTPIDPGSTNTQLPTSNNTQTQTPPSQNTQTDTPPPIVNRIVDNAVGNVTTGKNGGARLYNEGDGKFYRIDKNGILQALSDTTFFNVSDVAWSPVQDEAIIEYPDGANIYYNFQTKKQVTLPAHWEEFDFADNGSQIVAKSIAFSEENRWLITSDPEGNNIKPIEPLGANASKVIVDWSPSGESLGLARTGDPIEADRQEVLFVGQYGENFKSLIVEGRDLRTEWSPTGQKLLHSVYSARSGYIPELWIANSSGDDIGSGRKLLGLNTWADKCTFGDDRYVYCGVPTSIEKGAGFVPALADSTPDTIVRIDTQTGLKQTIPTDGIHTVDTIFVGDDGKTVYFTDKTQQGLFSIDL